MLRWTMVGFDEFLLLKKKLLFLMNKTINFYRILFAIRSVFASFSSHCKSSAFLARIGYSSFSSSTTASHYSMSACIWCGKALVFCDKYVGNLSGVFHDYMVSNRDFCILCGKWGLCIHERLNCQECPGIPKEFPVRMVFEELDIAENRNYIERKNDI